MDLPGVGIVTADDEADGDSIAAFQSGDGAWSREGKGLAVTDGDARSSSIQVTSFIRIILLWLLIYFVTSS